MVCFATDLFLLAVYFRRSYIQIGYLPQDKKEKKEKKEVVEAENIEAGEPKTWLHFRFYSWYDAEYQTPNIAFKVETIGIVILNT